MTISFQKKNNKLTAAGYFAGIKLSFSLFLLSTSGVELSIMWTVVICGFIQNKSNVCMLFCALECVPAFIQQTNIKWNMTKCLSCVKWRSWPIELLRYARVQQSKNDEERTRPVTDRPIEIHKQFDTLVNANEAHPKKATKKKNENSKSSWQHFIKILPSSNLTFALPFAALIDLNLVTSGRRTTSAGMAVVSIGARRIQTSLHRSFVRSLTCPCENRN